MYTGSTPGQFEFLNREAAQTLGRKIAVVATTTTAQELDDLIPALPRQGVEALIVTASPFVYDHREKFAALTAQYAIPQSIRFARMSRPAAL